MSWLRNLSMRNKLLLLILPSLFVMLLLAATNLWTSYSDYQEAHRIERLAEITSASAPVVVELQRERGMTALTIASNYSDSNVRQLRQQRQASDQVISRFLASVESVQQELALRQSTVDRVATLKRAAYEQWRNRVDSKQLQRPQMMQNYTSLISTMMGLIDDVVAESSQAQITRLLAVYSLAANAAESAGQERAAIAAYLAGEQFNLDDLAAIQQFSGQQQALLDNAFYSANSELKPTIEQLRQSSTLSNVKTVRSELIDDNVFSNVSSNDWFSISTRYITAINEAKNEILTTVTQMAEQLAADAFNGLLIMSLITAAVIAVIAVLATLILRGIYNQVAELLNGIDFVMTNKDLRRKVDSKSTDELGRIGNAFDNLLTKFSESLQKIDQMSLQLATATEETSSTAEQNADQIGKQQKQIEQVATATEEMSATASEISENIQRVADAADNSLQSKEKGAAAVRESITSVRALAEAIGNVGSVISQLQERSVDINRVIDVINNVAEQTNLLALNAAIEAARAGEHGRGFAVVADEVRQLASQTHNSTQEIADMLSSFRSLSDTAYNDINQSQSIAEATEEQAQELDRAFHVIAEDINSISEMSTQIATASEEQVNVAKDIAGNMESVNEVSLLTLTGSQEIKAVTQEQAKSARELQDLAMEFKTA